MLSTPFDFQAERGMSFRNYIADPEEWCNCFKVAADGPPGLWRLVFPADPEADEADLLSDEFVQEKMQKFFKRDADYDIVHRNLYNVHQRVAATFRLGRVLLAGDSAHVNNSIGGMGLNGGIQDAVNLTDKLAAVIVDGEDERLMDLYDKQRRSISSRSRPSPTRNGWKPPSRRHGRPTCRTCATWRPTRSRRGISCSAPR